MSLNDQCVISWVTKCRVLWNKITSYYVCRNVSFYLFVSYTVTTFSYHWLSILFTCGFIKMTSFCLHFMLLINHKELANELFTVSRKKSPTLSHNSFISHLCFFFVRNSPICCFKWLLLSENKSIAHSIPHSEIVEYNFLIFLSAGWKYKFVTIARILSALSTPRS